MTTINISIEVDQERLDALQGTVAELNSRRPEGAPEWTVEALLADRNRVYANERAQHYYQQTVVRFGDQFSGLPYDQRMAIIANLESQLP